MAVWLTEQVQDRLPAAAKAVWLTEQAQNRFPAAAAVGFDVRG